MTLVGIEPGNPGFELRIFKCLNCHRLQQYVVDSGGVLRTEGSSAADERKRAEALDHTTHHNPFPGDIR